MFKRYGYVEVGVWDSKLERFGGEPGGDGSKTFISVRGVGGKRDASVDGLLAAGERKE